MATTAQFFVTPDNEYNILGTAETDLLTPAHSVPLIEGTGSVGTKVNNLTVAAYTATISSGIVFTPCYLYLFIYSGSSYYLKHTLPMPVTERSYWFDDGEGDQHLPSLILPVGYTLKASISVTQLVIIQAQGADA